MAIDEPRSCRRETSKLAFEHSVHQETIVWVKSESLPKDGSFVKELFEASERLRPWVSHVFHGTKSLMNSRLNGY